MDISFVLCVVTLHIFPLEQPTINKYRVCHFNLCMCKLSLPACLRLTFY